MLLLVKKLSKRHPWLAGEAVKYMLRLGCLKDRALVRDFASVPTHMYADEKYALYWLAKYLRAGANVVEVGSYLGASACFLAAGLRDGKGGTVYCVDTWNNDAMNEAKRDTYPEFLRNTQSLQKFIAPLRGKSADVAAAYRGPAIDLLFIDGDHSYEGCNTDWQSWHRHLADEAVLAFHDYTRSEGIRTVVEEEVPRFFIIQLSHTVSSLHILWGRRKENS